MDLKELIQASYGIITNLLIPLAFALCLLYFFWGMAKYIQNSGSEKAVEEGKRVMVWGVVALFVVTSVWGIIKFIRSEIDLSPTSMVRPQVR
ncbi:MAG TPA: pilin [Candidatus Paceibacterota bacterium]